MQTDGSPVSSEVNGVLITGYQKALEELGLKAQVLAALPEETRRLMSKSNTLPTTFYDAVHMSNVFAGVLKTSDEQTLRDFGHRSTRALAGPFQTMLQMAFSIFGRTPAAAFRSGDGVVRLVLRGARVEYEETGPSSGQLTLQLSAPVDPAFFRGFAGSLLWVFDTCQCEGTSTLVRTSPDLREGRYELSWTESASR